MLSFSFKVFLAFLAHSRTNWFQLGLFGTKHCTQYNLLYVIVLKWLESKTIDICLKLHAKLRCLGCLAFVAFYRIKWCKHGLFPTKLNTQHYLVYVTVLKWLEFVTVPSFLFKVFLAF